MAVTSQQWACQQPRPQSMVLQHYFGISVLVRACLPLGVGILYDPFAGSGSTLAAAEAVGYRSIGTDSDAEYFRMASRAFRPLSELQVTELNEPRTDHPQIDLTATNLIPTRICRLS